MTLKKLLTKSHNLLIALLNVYDIDTKLINEIIARINTDADQILIECKCVEEKYGVEEKDLYMNCIEMFINTIKKSGHAKNIDDKHKCKYL